MRRATRPATCTQVTSRPVDVWNQMALRSFSTDALSSAALTKAPAWYHTCFTSPSTGERLECTLNTFMNTLTFTVSRFIQGSRAASTATMRPSAGETTVDASPGTSLGGSRKNCRTKMLASQNGIDHQPKNQVTISETTTMPVR